MGASSSTASNVSTEQREVETLAASTGALSMLQKSFTKLADPQTNLISLQSIEQCFSLSCKNPISEGPTMPDFFPELLNHVGSSIVDLLFIPQKEGISWVEFVKGYVKCCGRMSSSMSFVALLRVFSMTARKVGLSLKLEFESDEADSKINGSLLPIDVFALFLMCWAMFWDSRTNLSKGKQNLILPDINPLVLSAIVSCGEVGNDFNLWECDVSGKELELPVGKFLTWAYATVPTLTDCFTQFVHARLLNSCIAEDKPECSNSSAEENSIRKTHDSSLLTCGRAWAISLTFRSTIRDELLKSCFPDESVERDENILYRSSLHGRGLNRFWSNIEGYHGPLLILVSASCEDAQRSGSGEGKWIIGALLQQGFENKDMFYGSTGSLYALDPIFHAISPSGKEKNFVYSHLHGRVYEPHPKPVGIGFGGTIGNERIFIDEDFAKVTVRHHAVDKTYHSGSLIPNQGFLPVEGLISEVEVRGLGGRRTKEVQMSHKKREELFTEQRRKVDLSKFSNWEDSPEKMMMDMISDPNAVRREDR